MVGVDIPCADNCFDSSACIRSNRSFLGNLLSDFVSQAIDEIHKIRHLVSLGFWGNIRIDTFDARLERKRLLPAHSSLLYAVFVGRLFCHYSNNFVQLHLPKDLKTGENIFQAFFRAEKEIL